MADEHAQPDDLADHLDHVLIGGPEKRDIVIVDYDPAWPGRFQRERDRIHDALGTLARSVEHIGSTAVPELAAKPIIDVLVIVDDLDHEERYRPALERAGYVLRVREPGHRMFRTPGRDVHVHLWPPDDDEARRQLLFRDWLRHSSSDRRRYERVKRDLATRDWPDMNYYAKAKSQVITEILGRAERWSRGHP